MDDFYKKVVKKKYQHFNSYHDIISFFFFFQRVLNKQRMKKHLRTELLSNLQLFNEFVYFDNCEYMYVIRQ